VNLVSKQVAVLFGITCRGAQWCGVLRVKCSYATTNTYLVSYDGKQFDWELRSLM